jgi:L-lactate dehydrogenase complex protein LldG
MYEEFNRRVAEALESSEKLESMRAAFRSVIEKQQQNEERFPDLDERRERLRRVREECVGNAGLLDEAIGNLETNRFRVLRAKDASEAVRMVVDEMGDERLLVKSKTNLSKEIGLAAGLEAVGIELVETDIGDRIIQLSGEPTAHPTCPCAQLDRYDIARVLSEHLGREVDTDPNALIREIRDELVPLIERARIGLTGANAIAAAEGAVVLIHNEGNLDLVSQRPGKLIILAAPEKLYPNIEEAVNMAKLETYYATGQPVTSFMRVIGGPSKTADIEKELFYGIHGPSEVVIILVDNGRSELLADERMREALMCIGCGACLLRCPVYDVVGPMYGSPGHLGGVGVCADSCIPTPVTDPAQTVKLAASLEAGLPLCTTCAICTENCPVSVDVPRLIEELRARSTAGGLLPLEEHAPLISSIRNYANPWMQPRARRDRWSKDLDLKPRGETATGQAVFFAGCSLSYLEPGVPAAAVRMLRAVGIEPLYLGNEERCCGSPLLRLGEVELSEQLARENIELMKASGAHSVVALCPGCLKSLREYRQRFPEFDLDVRHISEILADAVADGRLKLKAPGDLAGMTLAYHDPCHLGRGCGIFEEPRKVLGAIEGLHVVEMERNRLAAACCGSGGGVKTAFSELSREIGRKRASMAREAGADAIVTICPWCEQNLSDHIPTFDLISLASDSL